MRSLAAFFAPCMSLVFAVPVEAATFVDATFNLSDYTITRSLQSGTATVSQAGSAGNPGSALLVTYVVPAAPPFTNTFGNVYFLNNTFTYDPANSGALSSISWSVDKEVNIIRPANFGLFNAQTFVIFQAGNYYASAVSLSSTQGVFQAANVTTSMNDFSLVTDLAVGTLNSTRHPSFSDGVMEFGFRNGYGIGPQIAAEMQILQDNFSVTLTPAVAAIPEPKTYVLLLAGLGLLAWGVARPRHIR